MPQILDLAPAAHEVASVARNVSDEQLTNPTPCEEYSVADLLTHLLGLSVAFRDAANKPSESRSPEEALATGLDPSWREKLPVRLDELVEAWQDPQAWDGMTSAGGIDLPGDIAGLVALDELVLHGWDLARATGQEFRCDEATTELVFEFARESAVDTSRDDSIFGPQVAVPADARMFDRALGYAGRDPQWMPPLPA